MLSNCSIIKKTVLIPPSFVRSAKPYKCHRKPCGANEYAFKRVPMNYSQNIDQSYRKVCSYPGIRKAGKAIITSFRRVLLQCFYVLEPLRWCLHREKMHQYPFTRPAKSSYPHSRGWQSHHIEKCAHTPMSYTTLWTLFRQVLSSSRLRCPLDFLAFV